MSQLTQTVKLARFNSRKRKGDAQRVVNALDGRYSYSYVRGVLSGHRTNESILNKGYRLAYRRLQNAV
jgi:hypothetical protein